MGAWRRTSAAWRAPSAWWARRAAEISDRGARIDSTLACKLCRRAWDRESSSARRASSCRKASAPCSSRTIPMLRQLSTPASSRHAACSSSHSSVFPGTTQTSSAISRAAGESLTARASTASRTVVGTASAPAAKTSVTNSGLPPVKPYRSFDGRPAWAASRLTAGSERGRSSIRCVWLCGRSPMTNLSGCLGPTSSSR